ncbi:hypothetical protein EYF80_059468 [Liparis tanakae]|uniref:Uncharacterized protein n=1 Tax=Liparis tanakae TaxID=230148 RepID=A0A4Z2ENQ5_9TELE|nr:hypothetical protein EYF80_059468 [Liparis tanakae]
MLTFDVNSDAMRPLWTRLHFLHQLVNNDSNNLNGERPRSLSLSRLLGSRLLGSRLLALDAPRLAAPDGGVVLRVRRGVAGRHGPRRRVAGLVVAVRVVVLGLAVVLEDVGRQLDCGDSAAVSDIIALCGEQAAGGEAARQRVSGSPKQRWPPPATTGSGVYISSIG